VNISPGAQQIAGTSDSPPPLSGSPHEAEARCIPGEKPTRYGKRKNDWVKVSYLDVSKNSGGNPPKSSMD